MITVSHRTPFTAQPLEAQAAAQTLALGDLPVLDDGGGGVGEVSGLQLRPDVVIDRICRRCGSKDREEDCGESQAHGR